MTLTRWPTENAKMKAAEFSNKEESIRNNKRVEINVVKAQYDNQKKQRVCATLSTPTLMVSPLL